jgi:hypothetical protein
MPELTASRGLAITRQVISTGQRPADNDEGNDNDNDKGNGQPRLATERTDRLCATDDTGGSDEYW